MFAGEDIVLAEELGGRVSHLGAHNRASIVALGTSMLEILSNLVHKVTDAVFSTALTDVEAQLTMTPTTAL